MVERMIAATDGAAQPNPGPAGWAWVMGDARGHPARGESGYLGDATNNVGELTAVAELLKATDSAVPLEVRIDSQYAMNAVTKWLPKQRQRGFTTTDGKPIKNRDLIVHIDELLSGRDITFTWVRAHQSDGDALNALADRAAQDTVRQRRGDSWTGAANAPAVELSQPAQDSSVRTNSPATSAAGRCGATTKAGKPCPIEPRPSGLCHVHDPTVQCQAITSKGRPCTAATGGERCKQHRDQVL
ncbi:ribonuclease H family protein [Halosaccharopolyspora lacisalsi]|nr:ribonuclease H [Halosaccharopolyspora lacisalsi]